VGLYWVPGHAGIRGNEVADELARGGSVRGFLGPEPALGVSRQEVLVEPSDRPENSSWGPIQGPQQN
jgi:hypothetical protein